jgi:hypothetical protein
MYISQKHQTQRLGSFEGQLGLLPMVGISSGVAAAALVSAISNPANWAAPPVNTHASWQSHFPGAKIASGYILSQSNDGRVAISKDGRNITQYMPISQLAGGIQKDSTGKIVFACCNISTSSTSGATTSPTTPSTTPSTTPASTPVSSGPSAGEVLTGVGSILSALATPAAGVFQTYTESKLARAQLKREQQAMPVGPSFMPPQVIQQGPGIGLILGVAGGFVALALILILVLKK